MLSELRTHAWLSNDGFTKLSGMRLVKQIATLTRQRSLLWLFVQSAKPLTASPLHSCATPSRTAPRLHHSFRASARQMSTGTPKVRSETELSPGQSVADHQQAPKLAKRKVALFVAYVGSSFRGGVHISRQPAARQPAAANCIWCCRATVTNQKPWRHC